MQKLDTFKGKIDFKKDSPKKIQKTLDNLQEYLSNYEENEASEIIEQLKDKDGTQRDKIEAKKFQKLYERRTKVLEDLQKTFKKIKEDLIDEQDTSIKKRPERAKSKIINNIKNTTEKVTGAVKDGSNKIKDFFSNILKKLLAFKKLPALLLAGLAGFLLTSLTAIGGFLVSAAWKGVKFVGKILIKSMIWIGKKLVKLVTKVVIKVAKVLGSLLMKMGKAVVRIATAGLKKLGGLLKSMWDAVKKMTSGLGKKVKNAGKSAGKAAKSGAGALGAAIKSKLGGKTGKKAIAGGKALIEKAKAAIAAVKNVVLPNLKKTGKKGAAKAVSKALGKMASRAVPFLGWGLLAYEAYEAAKISDSVTSFGINLLDGVSGGLISLAVGDTNGQDLGSYIEGMIFPDSTNPDSPDTAGNPDGSVSSSGGAVTAGGAAPGGPDVIDEASRTNIFSFNNLQSFNSSQINDTSSKYTTGDSISGVNNTYNSNASNYSSSNSSSSHVNANLVKKNVTINNTNKELLQNVKDQAVYESVAISEKMNANAYGVTSGLIKTTVVNNNNQNIVVNNNPLYAQPSLITQG